MLKTGNSFSTQYAVKNPVNKIKGDQNFAPRLHSTRGAASISKTHELIENHEIGEHWLKEKNSKSPKKEGDASELRPSFNNQKPSRNGAPKTYTTKDSADQTKGNPNPHLRLHLAKRGVSKYKNHLMEENIALGESWLENKNSQPVDNHPKETKNGGTSRLRFLLDKRGLARDDNHKTQENSKDTPHRPEDKNAPSSHGKTNDNNKKLINSDSEKKFEIRENRPETRKNGETSSNGQPIPKNQNPAGNSHPLKNPHIERAAYWRPGGGMPPIVAEFYRSRTISLAAEMQSNSNRNSSKLKRFFLAPFQSLRDAFKK